MSVGQKKHRIRFAFLSLIAVMALSGLYTLISAPPAFAASQQECFDRFNNKPYEYARLSIAEQTLLNQCRSEGFCLVKSTDRDTNQITLTCSNPIISAGTATAADKEVAPLVTLVCGSPPASDTLMDNYLSCGAKVRKIYSSCDNTGGSITSNMQDSDQNTAKCVYQKLSNPKPSQAKVLAAVKQGRADATKATDEAVSNAQIDAARKACEERIKKGEKVEWKNNECVASTEGGNNSTCRVNGVGWIICPVVNFLAGITDMAYAAVATMLTVPAVNTNTSDTSNELYKAWSVVRNIANVCFVIAFLVIIYSQITSAGISNYGIKKLLPKLVISAVLVNVSYWICALAVDLSNFLGYAISGMFATVGKSIMGEAPTTLNSGNSFTALAAGVLVAGAAVAFLQLSMLLPLLVGAVLVITVVVIILTLRQGLIVMLIVISPLAFVAYLLPNTSKLFNRWWDAFKALLLMFPVVAFVYAGSALAGKVLSGVAEDMNGGMKVGFQIMAAALPILSFITVYTLMKTSSALLGKLMDNNPARGIGDRMKRGAENRGKRWDNQRAAYANKTGGFKGFTVGGRARSRAKSAAIDQAAQRNLQRSQEAYVADQAVNGGKSFTNYATGGRFGSENKFASQLSRGSGQEGLQRAISDAQFTIEEAEIKEAKAARVSFERAGLDGMGAGSKLLSDNENSFTRAQRTALRSMAVEAGDAKQISEIWDKMGEADVSQSELNAFASDLTKNKPTGIGMGSIAGLRSYAAKKEAASRDSSAKVPQFSTFDEQLAKGIVDGRYDPSGAAKSDNSELEIVRKLANNPDSLKQSVRIKLATENNVSPDSVSDVDIQTRTDQVLAKLRTDAHTASTDPRFNAGKARASLDAIVKDLGGPPQAASTSSNPPTTTSHQGQTFTQSDGGLYIPRQ